MAVKEEDEDRRRRPAQSQATKPGDTRGSPKKRRATPEVGQALRSIYQKTIDEDIPPEMLDLLGKLG